MQSHPFFKEINFRMLEAGLVEPPFKPDVRAHTICCIAKGVIRLHYFSLSHCKRLVEFEHFSINVDICSCLYSCGGKAQTGVLQ